MDINFHYHTVKTIARMAGFNEDDAHRTQYRTQAADITGSSLIATLLRNAKNIYMGETNPVEKRFDLIRVGITLHIFADTYAHQGFSGYHGWENYSYITELKDAATLEPVSDSDSPDYFGGVYSIGHANAGHAPDMTYAYFGMSYAENENQKNKDSYTGRYSRSNTQVFSDAVIN